MVSLTERGSEWVVCWLSVCGWMVNFFGPLSQKRQNEKQLRLSKSQIEVRECRVLSIEMGPRGLSGGGCALLRPFLVTWRATIGLEGYKQEGDKEPSSQRDHAPLSLDMCVCSLLRVVPRLKAKQPFTSLDTHTSSRRLMLYLPHPWKKQEKSIVKMLLQIIILELCV